MDKPALKDAGAEAQVRRKRHCPGAPRTTLPHAACWPSRRRGAFRHPKRRDRTNERCDAKARQREPALFSVDNDEQSRLERHGVAFAGLEAIAAGEAFDAGDRVVEELHWQRSTVLIRVQESRSGSFPA
ncbi:hypothetical protein HGG75_04350 [Ochrobactrum pseudogrignonense]|nr:hypothetical protein [Brucella pseudogrignonensis]